MSRFARLPRWHRHRSAFAEAVRAAAACALPVELLESRCLLSATPAAVRIDAGGPAYTDSAGNQWAADTDYSGGSTTDQAYPVANTSDPSLIYSRRWGNFSYNIPLSNGTYTLSLYFAEPRDTGPDQRLFDVSAQGTAILTNFDIYATAGYQTEVTESFIVTVANGSLNLTFTTIKDTACVSAIAVLPGGSTTGLPSAPSSRVLIDAGGPAYTDSAGNQWSADTDYSGGSTTDQAYPVANTDDPELIYSRRWGNFSYNIPLANGSYTLELFFAEPRDTGPDQRLFDVTAQNQPILTNFDIYAVAGYQTEVTESFTVLVNNGTLGLTFTTIRDTACVSAIEVAPLGTVTPPSNPTPTSAGPLGSPWSDTDIGSPADAGQATQSDNGSVITVDGGGADIWGDTDAFNFAYQPLVGDGSIIAQVTAEQDTDPWAKAGIMIRETTNDDSRYVMLALTPGYGVTFQERSATHNTTVHNTTPATVGDWLKLVRSGSSFTAYLSSDGSNWTEVGSASIPMVNNVEIGLCVTAHNNSDLNTSSFQHVSVSATGTAASSWSDGATAPALGWEAQSVTYDNKLYLFGGFDDESMDETAACESFDPATNTWSYVTEIPIGGLTHAGTVLAGDMVYFAGGDVGTFTYGNTETATDAVLTYNLGTNTWGTLPSLPAKISCGGLVDINNVLYYYGGINSADNTDLSTTYALNLNDLSAGWVTKAPMPNARNHIGYAEINGIAYAIGGQHLYDAWGGNVAEVDAYNPATNTWTQVASLPQTWSSFHVSTIVVNNQIVILGGATNGGYDGIYQNLIDQYNPATNQWSNVGTLPEANEGLSAAYINGELIAVDGTVDNYGGFAQDQTWETDSLSF